MRGDQRQLKFVKLRCLAAIAAFCTSLFCTGCGPSKQHIESQLPEKQKHEKTVPPVVSKVNDVRQKIPRIKSPSAGQMGTRVMNKRKITALGQAPVVKGIYVSGWAAGNPRRMNRILSLLKNTDLNAVVIDVKNDYGRLTYRSDVRGAGEAGADKSPAIRDIRLLIKQLKASNIYIIGRVVTFKDPLYAKAHNGFALQKRGGGVWRDNKGEIWLNPYNQAVRAYNIAIGEEAARLGFDEIQYDYVRFPDNGAKVDREVNYGIKRLVSKAAIIETFLKEAKPRIHAAGAIVSADVFGLVTSSRDDMGIGQTWRAIAGTADAISPMTYPSHYSSGMYNVRNPDLQPYSIIRRAMRDAQSRNGILLQEWGRAAIIRPWLQSFTATWVHPHQRYGYEEVRSQIKAAQEAGVQEFLLWDSSCTYEYRS